VQVAYPLNTLFLTVIVTFGSNLAVRVFLCYHPSIFTTWKEAAAILTYNVDGVLTPEETKDLIEQSLDADKAEDIISIKIGDQTGLSDYMIIASGTSSRHVNALASKLKDRLAARGIKQLKIEGAAQCDWVAIDAGDVIVHLFRPEVREFYNLEKMWGVVQPLDSADGENPMQA
jgi:ribosome-associated protein